MLLKKSCFSLVLILISNSMNLLAGESTLDNTLSVLKGTASAVVAGTAASGFASFFRYDEFGESACSKLLEKDEVHEWAGWSAKAVRTISYAYAASKLSSYSRKCFNLRPGVLLDGLARPIARDRKTAFVNLITSGIVGLVSAYYAVKTPINAFSNTCEYKKHTHDSAPTLNKIDGLGKSAALIYTCYKSLPDAYYNARVAFVI